MASSVKQPDVSTDDLLALKESITGVLERSCSSLELHEFADGKLDLHSQVRQLAVDLEWLGVNVPADCGGLEMGLAALDVLYRELGRVAAPGDLLSTLVGMQMLCECATPEVRLRLLPRAIRLEERIAIAMAAGCEPLRQVGDKVEGVSAGYLGPADATLAIAPVDCGDLRMALVRLDAKGGRIDQRSTWDVTRSGGNIECDGAEVLCWLGPDAAVGLQSYHRSLNLAVAADCIGGAQEILSRTIEYMKGRVQFGQPIALFQALKHRVANVKIALTAAEGLHQFALRLASQGHRDAEFWSRLAKAEAARAYKKTAEESVLLHGGVGFTVEYDCHFYVKRARMNERLGGEGSANLAYASHYLQAATAEGKSLAEIEW